MLNPHGNLALPKTKVSESLGLQNQDLQSQLVKLQGSSAGSVSLQLLFSNLGFHPPY